MREQWSAELQELYRGSYVRLVSVVGAIHGDRDEAEEAVQEAFARLLGRWGTVSRYDDPEAWVRTAALRICRNKQRKFLNGLKAVRRHGAADPMPGPTGDAVDLGRAVGRLPRHQREVVVLHHLGLDTAAVAAQLGIPEGTVKSRLSRARAVLCEALREDEGDDVRAR